MMTLDDDCNGCIGDNLGKVDDFADACLQAHSQRFLHQSPPKRGGFVFLWWIMRYFLPYEAFGFGLVFFASLWPDKSYLAVFFGLPSYVGQTPSSSRGFCDSLPRGAGERGKVSSLGGKPSHSIHQQTLENIRMIWTKISKYQWDESESIDEGSCHLAWLEDTRPLSDLAQASKSWMVLLSSLSPWVQPSTSS